LYVGLLYVLDKILSCVWVCCMYCRTRYLVVYGFVVCIVGQDVLLCMGLLYVLYELCKLVVTLTQIYQLEAKYYLASTVQENKNTGKP